MTIWSREEINILCDNYPTGTKAQLQELLPNKTNRQVCNIALSMGMSKTKDTLSRTRRRSAKAQLLRMKDAQNETVKALKAAQSCIKSGDREGALSLIEKAIVLTDETRRNRVIG